VADSPAIYVLTGSDALLRDHWKKSLLDELLGDADRQLALSTFEPDAPLAEVLDTLRTPPLLGPPKRVVVVRDADTFISAHRDALAKCLANPPKSGVLLLLCANLDKRTRFAKALKPPVAKVIECNAPEGAALVQWIQQAAGQYGKTLAGPVSEMLATGIGSDLATLYNEIAKLATYVGDNPQITIDDVTAVVTASASPENFALVNALVAGDVARALDTLQSTLTVRGAEFAIMGQIAWHMRRAMQISAAVAEGQSPSAAMKTAKIWGNQQRDYQNLIQRRPLTKLRSDMRRLIATDLAMKSGQQAKPAMQQLLIALCS
jgi:DNA polymerase-3 subunit delta